LKESREKDQSSKCDEDEGEDEERVYGGSKHERRNKRSTQAPRDGRRHRIYGAEQGKDLYYQSPHHGGRFDSAYDAPPESALVVHQRHQHRHASDETHGRLKKKKGTVKKVLEWL